MSVCGRRAGGVLGGVGSVGRDVGGAWGCVVHGMRSCAAGYLVSVAPSH